MVVKTSTTWRRDSAPSGVRANDSRAISAKPGPHQTSTMLALRMRSETSQRAKKTPAVTASVAV